MIFYGPQCIALINVISNAQEIL